jgi:hypothetical protein
VSTRTDSLFALERLRHRDGAKRRAGAVLAGNSDPMIEAGATSTGSLTTHVSVVPAPPGVYMVAPPEVPRNAQRAQSIGRARKVN